MPAATNAQQSSQPVDRFLVVCALMLDVCSDLLPHRATRPVVCDSCILTHARRRVYAQRDDGFFVRGAALDGARVRAAACLAAELAGLADDVAQSSSGT